MERHGCNTLAELREHLGLKSDHVYSHALESLVTDLLPKGTRKRLFDGEAGMAFTSKVNAWSPDWRYDPRTPGMTEATTFLEAIDEVWNWLESNA